MASRLSVLRLGRIGQGLVMLKTKGTPKAGPKKRRAKNEQEAIRAAVDESGRRTVRASRKAGRLNKYSYKDLDADKKRRQAQTAKEREEALAYSLRPPKEPTAFEEFYAKLSDGERVFAVMYWHMQCEHAKEVVIVETASFVNGNEPEMTECQDCGITRQWHGTKTETKRQEWIGYCPEGYDMWDWMALYVKDRSLWQFIHDEVLAEQLEGVTL